MLKKVTVIGWVGLVASLSFAGMAAGRGPANALPAGNGVPARGMGGGERLSGLGELFPELKNDPAVQAEIERHKTALENLRVSRQTLMTAIANDVKNGTDRQTAVNNHYNEMVEQAKKRIAEGVLFHKNLASIVEQKEGDLAKQLVDRFIERMGERRGGMKAGNGARAGRAQPNAGGAAGRAPAEF